MKKLILFTALLTLSLSSFAKSYSMAYINLGYGKLDVSSGGGDIIATVDSHNQLTHIKVDVTAGMFGMSETIEKTMSVKELMTGETFNFYMSGSIEPVLKIKALKGLGPDGGKIKLSYRKSDGFYYHEIEVARGVRTKNFNLWDGENMIEEVAINMRGGSPKNMYVGWSELVFVNE